MDKMKQILLLVLFVLAGMQLSQSAGESSEEILEKVRKRYDSINDAQVKFSQKTMFSISKLEQRTEGTLLVKKQNKYRVEFEDQTIVTNGQTVWSFSASNNQVLIDNFKMDERSFSPEKILTGAPGDFSSTLLGTDKQGKYTLTMLKLVPKGDQSVVAVLKLWVDNADWMIRKVEITDINGKQTVYTVNDIKVNTGLQDSRFIYQIPSGVEVVDLR